MLSGAYAQRLDDPVRGLLESQPATVVLHQANSEVVEGPRENARRKLAQVIEFCELQTCRRKFLLEYFGENTRLGNCGGCDVCLTPTEEYDATVISQKFDLFVKTPRQPGARWG